jgi:hypothetical protein
LRENSARNIKEEKALSSDNEGIESESIESPDRNTASDDSDTIENT